MMQEETKGRIDCYNINMWNDELKSFDGGRITMSGDYAIQPTISMKFDPFDLIQPNLQQEGYQRIKSWYEVMTVVNQRQFFKEVYLWNQMCKENNAVLKIFAINDQTWLPKDLNIIGNVQADVSDETVTQFLLTKGVLQDFVVDDEHFNVKAHTLIANEYIPNIGKE